MTNIIFIFTCRLTLLEFIIGLYMPNIRKKIKVFTKYKSNHNYEYSEDSSNKPEKIIHLQNLSFMINFFIIVSKYQSGNSLIMCFILRDRDPICVHLKDLCKVIIVFKWEVPVVFPFVLIVPKSKP